VTERLQRHVSEHWRDRCRELSLRLRGPFDYLDAFSAREKPRPAFRTPEEWEGVLKIPTHLCRPRYTGTADLWEFAFYAYSSESYKPSFLPSGRFEGTPEECFDCAAAVYLQ